MKRLAFANQLRGVAALSVAASHLVGVFWLMRDVVSAVTFTPAPPGPPDPLVVIATHPWFNGGPFGVAVFFLISGLVIPVSLAEHTRAGFLVARLLRIYPLYAAALLIEMAVLAGNARYWGLPFTITARQLAANLLLVQDLTGQPSLDLVNWTLCTELRFYLVMALAAPLVRRGNVALLFGLAGLACALNLLVGSSLLAPWIGPPMPDPALLAYAISTETLFGCFMLVGVLFNYHLRGLVGTGGLFAGTAGLLVLFAACWSWSVLGAQVPGVTWNYLCALALFAALYAVRDRVPANRLLDALASLSFPFYCVHALVGYSLLRLLMVAGHVSYPVALAVTLAVLAALALVLHMGVERPMIRLGKGLRRARSRPVITPCSMSPEIIEIAASNGTVGS